MGEWGSKVNMLNVYYKTTNGPSLKQVKSRFEKCHRNIGIGVDATTPVIKFFIAVLCLCINKTN